MSGTANATVTETTSTTCSAPAWNASTAYSSPGTKVSYNGKEYSNQWWTQGEQPDLNTGSGKVWVDLGACSVGDNKPPSVSITAPSSSVSQTSLSPLTLRASASDTDGTISSVVFSIDGKTINGTSEGNGSYAGSWTPSAFGTYTLNVTAKDNGGLSVSSSKSITVTQSTSTGFIISEEEFNQIFPYRFGVDQSTGYIDPAKDFFSYKNFIEAVNRMKQIEALFERRQGTNLYRITQKNKSTGVSKVIRTDPDFNASYNTSKPIISQTIDYGSFLREYLP